MAAVAAATAATIAYLNAKWRLPVDFHLLSTTAKTIYFLRRREKQDRLNAFYIVEENALNKKVADNVFLWYEGKSWTFRQYYDIVLRYAGWLRSTHSVAQGEVVAIDFMNSPELLFLVAAIWSLGAVPALINYNLSGEPLAHSLRTSAARLFIVEPEVAANVLTPETKSKLSTPTFRNNAFPLETIVLDPGLQSSLAYFKQYRAPDSARSGMEASSPAALISTSGTTGMPKQAIVAVMRFLAGAQGSSYNCGMRPVTSPNHDIFYTAMPLYHGTAFITAFGLSLVTPSTLAIARRFSASKFWPDIRRYNATVIQYVGEALRYLVAAPSKGEDDKKHKVRLAFGNGCRPDVWKKFKARFGIEEMAEFYAATEGTFATWNINRNDFSDGAVASVGKINQLLLSRRLALVEVDWEQEEPWRDPTTGFCAKVASGQAGELLAKLDATNQRVEFPGYFNNEKASQQKILRNVFEKDDAYFRTGDVLRWDSDGRLWFSDRIGDTFRWKSENVSTMEVGEVIGYHPAVLEANVYGVSVPGHEGRAGCAAVLLHESALEAGQDGISVKPDILRSLATYSRNSMQKASVPVFLRAVKEMTATGNNKSIKHVFRNQGVDLQAIQTVGSGDQLYWLTPDAESYVRFDQGDWTALSSGKVRL